MNKMSDGHEQVLEQLLRKATQPQPPLGAEARLMARVRASSVAARPSNVLSSPHPRKSGWKNYISFGLPIAASLLLGIMFGSGNTMIENYLPESFATLIYPSNGLELDLPFTLDDGDLTDGSLA